MKVKIIKPKKYICGEGGVPHPAGAVIEVAPELGHAWAGQGLALVVKHDKPSGPSGKIVKDEAYYRAKRRASAHEARMEEPLGDESETTIQEMKNATVKRPTARRKK